MSIDCMKSEEQICDEIGDKIYKNLIGRKNNETMVMTIILSVLDEYSFLIDIDQTKVKIFANQTDLHIDADIVFK